MYECSRCGTRMSHNDETTKLTEYVCPRCHNTEIEQKKQYRVTAEADTAVTPAADDD
jgi:DNA-directed RNA polymerase subunit RPC12/RpoP